VRGLVFDVSVARYALAKSVGKAWPKLNYGALSGLKLREVPQPKLPAGKGWVRLKSVLAGFCGSDLACIFFKMSPLLEPFGSFPSVLGHEILGEVAELGEGVEGLEVGQKVAVDPVIPCRLRGFDQPCKPCSLGLEGCCDRFAEGCHAPGTMIGFHKDFPGGFSDELVAHQSQLYPLPHDLPDKAGVLVEPLSVSLHAVLKTTPKDDDQVLIIGGGPVAFAALWAIRAVGCKAKVTLLTVEGYQVELAKKLGADEVMRAQRDDIDEAKEVARRTGAQVYSPIIGPPVLAGGFDVVYDCVGSQLSVTDALRYVRSLGKIVLIGAAATIDKLDWTMIWNRELTIQGSYVYGRENFRGKPMHTFAVTRELLSKREGPDVTPLVTHAFKLDDYATAIEANLKRGQYQSVKTVFQMRPS
jgi:L-iditol 2-dehydrogenase